MRIWDLLRRLCDVFVREPRLIYKYYVNQRSTPPSGGWGTGPRMVFKADGRFPHGGMFDRLKGAISVYAAAQCIGREFRIAFTHPFDLRDYLVPNEYDWRIDESELKKRWPAARPIFMYGEYGNPVRLVKRRRGESHFYYGYNSLDWLNKRYGRNYEFGELYRQLFRPTEKLQRYIDHYKAEIGGGYIAVHFRFMNLIGDSTEFTDVNPTLPAEEQERLIERSLEQLRILAEKHSGKVIMLATDSARFVSIVKERMPAVYVVPGEIRHIGTAEDNSDASTVKMFLDYYLIAGAEKVYNLVSEGMWKSAFPEYAAKIGGVEFERVFFGL
ncbi:MAG: hypothetical protein HUK06_03445 [Bacteroidaceae bacterium]|nr:hypothetical protein [Bacteroidaceae bacterium]